MAGLFSRVKTWAAETVTHTDLNAEFDNVLANVDVTHSEGASQNQAAMQATENPGAVGTENLTQPVSALQEIKRLRYVIKRLIGGAQWYTAPTVDLNTVSASVTDSLNLPANRIVSGKLSSFNQPDFIRANTTSVSLLCTATPFVCLINGTSYTFSSDITLSTLSAGFSSLHTALNGDTFSGGEDSRTYGETVSLYQFDFDRSYLTIGTVGSQITGRIGQTAAFKIVVGGTTEYFLGKVETATQLKNLYRGYFRDTSGTPTLIAAPINGETITLLRLTYLFLNTSGVLIACYTEPFYQADTPASPATGDFWFDIANDTWKIYGGAGWSSANALLVGICAQDSTGCIISRSADFYKNFTDVNEVAIGDPPASGSIYYSSRRGGKVNVYGEDVTRINYWSWDLANDVDTGLSAASGVWYFYITNTGDTVLSTVHPNDRSGTLRGYYHPAKPWRCIGHATAASASTWSTTAFTSYGAQSLYSQADASISLRRVEPRVTAGDYTSTVGLGKVAKSGYVDASIATDQTSTSQTAVDITNLSVTITVSGKRPVWIGFVGHAEGTQKEDFFKIVETSGSGLLAAIGVVDILRGATLIRRSKFGCALPTVSASHGMMVPCGAFSTVDFNVTPGTYTYKAQMYCAHATSTITAAANVRLVAYEIL